MSFLQPWAFLLLGLSVPLLLLYFLKVRRQQRRVSSVLLWSPVFRDQQASALFQRLQLDPLLLLQLLALLLLCAALARPDPDAPGQGRRAADLRGGHLGLDEGPGRRVEPAPRSPAAGGHPDRRGGPGRRADGHRGGLAADDSAPLHPRPRPGAAGRLRPRRARPAEPPERGDPDGAGARAPGRPASARARADRRRVRPGSGPGVPRPAGPVGHGRGRRPQRRDHPVRRPEGLLRGLRLPGVPVRHQLLRRARLLPARPDGRRPEDQRADDRARPPGEAERHRPLHPPDRGGRQGRRRRPGRSRGGQRRPGGGAGAAEVPRSPRESRQPVPGEGAPHGPAGDPRDEDPRRVLREAWAPTTWSSSTARRPRRSAPAASSSSTRPRATYRSSPSARSSSPSCSTGLGTTP